MEERIMDDNVYMPPELNDSRGPEDVTPKGVIVVPIVAAVV